MVMLCCVELHSAWGYPLGRLLYTIPEVSIMSSFPKLSRSCLKARPELHTSQDKSSSLFLFAGTPHCANNRVCNYPRNYVEALSLNWDSLLSKTAQNCPLVPLLSCLVFPQENAQRCPSGSHLTATIGVPDNKDYALEFSIQAWATHSQWPVSLLATWNCVVWSY